MLFMSSLRARSKPRMHSCPSNCSTARLESSQARQDSMLKNPDLADTQTFRCLVLKVLVKRADRIARCCWLTRYSWKTETPMFGLALASTFGSVHSSPSSMVQIQPNSSSSGTIPSSISTTCRRLS
ncbi:hypothetical protein D9M71_425350 [compost metagenome]